MSTALDVEKSISFDGETKPQANSPGSGPPVFVVFTSINGTLNALGEASQLAERLKAGIEILAIQTIPYCLPLDDPSVPSKFLAGRLQKMAAHFPGRIRISPYLCRDLLDALKRILNRNCPVVMGVWKRWWPTRDQRTARRLRRAGYNVILVETR